MPFYAEQINYLQENSYEKLSLTLFMFQCCTNNTNSAITFNNLTVPAYFFY